MKISALSVVVLVCFMEAVMAAMKSRSSRNSGRAARKPEIWMHKTVISIMHMATPELANKFEHDHHAPLDKEAPFVDSDELEETGAKS